MVVTVANANAKLAAKKNVTTYLGQEENVLVTQERTNSSVVLKDVST